MINVTVFQKESKITAFEISGHAESGPYGYDLVCAGVSAVSFGTVNAIIEICGINLDIVQADEGGYLKISVPSFISKEDRNKAQILLEGMVVSLETIEREYSKFIKILKKQEV